MILTNVPVGSAAEGAHWRAVLKAAPCSLGLCDTCPGFVCSFGFWSFAHEDVLNLPQNLDLHLSLGHIIFAFSVKSTLLCVRSSHLKMYAS